MSELYKLVIVESFAKCKRIEHYLNNNTKSTINYKCIASCGHIREISGLEAIDIHNNFAPTFVECESKKAQNKKIKKAIKDATDVILATDDDREGEAIAWHLCQFFNLSVEKTQRIIFHEITEQALHKAIDLPRSINILIVNAQLARQVLDMLVGYCLSPILWKHVKDNLSAGRCQTPALRLIYDNQREIDMAPGPQQYYVVSGYFTNKTIPFVLNHKETDENKMRDFLEESRMYSHVFKNIQIRTKTSAAPQPFLTSTLQQAASNEFNLSPKETMTLCQSLYENGYITYPRTDNHIFSCKFKAKIAHYITKTYGEKYVNSMQHTSLNDTIFAHEAIRPTSIDCESIHGDNSRETRLYKLIRRRTIESCMTDSITSVLTATITAPQQYDYSYVSEQIIFAGWQIINAGENNTLMNNEYNYLQSLKPSISLPLQKIKAQIHLTETKQHYTEAKLVNLLETKGIGRPSTFSSLIDKIQDRKYVRKENIKGKIIMCTEFEIDNRILKTTQSEREFGSEKNKLVITNLGILTIEFLLQHFEPFFQYTYTKQMEDDLDFIVKDKLIWHDICKKYYDDLQRLSAFIAERGKETIRIDAEHTYIIGKYGPVIKYIPSLSAATDVLNTNKKTLFKAVRKDLDLNKLRQGGYTLADVLDIETYSENISNDNQTALILPTASIGFYQEKPVYIKVGRFGKYLEWNGINKSLKHIKQLPLKITMQDISELLFDTVNEMEQTRILGPDASIKKGEFGYYIYYKNKKMKKPRFLKLDGFPDSDYMTCHLEKIKDWFTTTYKMNL